MDDTQRQVLDSIPLAQASHVIWRHIADDEALEQVFERSRGRCYTREIAFPTFVQLIYDALTQHAGSGNQCFQNAAEDGTLTASTRAAYAKLGRMPIEVSVDLFSTMVDRLRELLPTDVASRLPKSLSQMQVFTVDGKTVKRISKRLKPLRNVRCGLSGGKALVATEYDSGLAVGMTVDPDGHANDVRLLPGLIENLRGRFDGARLWLADRQFCDLIQLGRFSEQGDHYVVRYNAKAKFTRDETQTVHEGKDKSGRKYIDECGWLGADSNRNQRYVRRITLQLGGGKELSIVTELFGVRKYPATDLLDLYADRWEIERVFQRVTEVFSLENLIGGTPQANLFQLALCLLIYNQLQVVRNHIAKHQDRDSDEISIENLFTDVKRELIAWTVLHPVLSLDDCVPRLRVSESRKRLAKLLEKAWRPFWIKSINAPHRKTQKHATKKKHTSVHKILNPKPT